MFWSSWKISLTEFSDVWLTAKTADNGLSGMMLLGWRYSLPKADILAQLRAKLGSDSDHTRQYYWVTSFQHPHRQDHVKGTQQQQQRNCTYLVSYVRNALTSYKDQDLERQERLFLTRKQPTWNAKAKKKKRIKGGDCAVSPWRVLTITLAKKGKNPISARQVNQEGTDLLHSLCSKHHQ